MFFNGSKKFTRHQNFAIEKKDKREKGLNVFFCHKEETVEANFSHKGRSSFFFFFARNVEFVAGASTKRRKEEKTTERIHSYQIFKPNHKITSEVQKTKRSPLTDPQLMAQAHFFSLKSMIHFFHSWSKSFCSSSDATHLNAT